MRKIFILIFALFALISCGEKSSSGSDAAANQVKKRDILNVTVSIPPQAYIVKSVGREKVNVSIMLPPSSMPETYEPGPQKMADLKNSALYFKIGVPFEAASVERLAQDYKNVRFVEMHKGIKMRKMEGHHHHHHGHEHAEKEEDCDDTACPIPGLEEPEDKEEEHREHHHHHHDGENHEDCPHYKEHHGMDDPHVWLDPENLIVMTDNTVAALSQADPENAAIYRENGEALKNELRKVENEISAQLKDAAGKSFVVHHPAFGYFADRFGLKQVPLEVEGKEPGAAGIAKVVDFIKKNSAKAVFMQAQMPDSTIRSVAEETKIRIVVLDPLKENVIENIKTIASDIKGALTDEK